jgi:hypothetical protein
MRYPVLEQPPYSILNRGIEAEVLPVAQRFGMGTLVWSPLAKGMLTGRIRKGQQTDLRRAAILTSFSDEARLDAVEQIIPVAEKADLPMTHLAMAFAIAHPGVTSALIGPRTMEQLDDLLAGIDVTLTDDILDQIDEIVPPGIDVSLPDQSAYLPRPSCTRTSAAAPPANAPPPDLTPRDAYAALSGNEKLSVRDTGHDGLCATTQRQPRPPAWHWPSLLRTYIIVQLRF